MPAKKPRGRPGPKPTQNTAKVSTLLPPQQRRALLAEVQKRKLADPDLPIRWGLADLLREIVAAHLAKTARKPARK